MRGRGDVGERKAQREHARAARLPREAGDANPDKTVPCSDQLSYGPVAQILLR
jgi:hypothetical protein